MTLSIDVIDMYYGRTHALDQVSMRIPQGIYGLLGQNGAGKTTLIRILATLLKQNGGTMEMEGMNWRKPNTVRRSLGYLPQQFAIYRHLTVRETLEHVAAMKRVPRPSVRREVDRALEATNLEAQSSKKVRALSGGMTRRLGIAQAIIGSPRLLLLDEPTVGLDPQERLRFRHLLQEVGNESVVLLSSHIVDDIQNLCPRVGILHEGKLLFDGDMSEAIRLSDGHTYECTVDKATLAAMLKEPSIMVLKYSGTSDAVAVRFIGDEPLHGAQSVPGALEDSYMWLMRAQR